MDSLQFTRKDGLFITACLVILAAGIIIGLKYFHQAFPEAAITFRYNRAQSETIAQTFLSTVRLDPPADFRHAGRFGYDGTAKTYLEKELGIEGAGRYLGKPVRLWYWQHRWFRPSTKEEFKVFVTPEGDVVRLSHEIEEQAAGAELSQDSARSIAETFLFGPMGQHKDKLTFIEAQRTGRPHRYDWRFTYRATGIEPVKGSEYRYEMTVLGDQIGGYREFLHVPEAWFQSFSRLRSFNTMAGGFADVGFVLTIIALGGVLFLRVRRRDIKWKTAIAFGAVATALVLLNRINEFPLQMYGYDTTTSWGGFLTETILYGLLEAFGAGLGIFLLTASAEPLYRERYGNKFALSRMFSLQALQTKTAFKSILLGVTLTAFFFAYQIAFYLLAGKFGAWSPSDVPYDNLLNTAMPWLAVLAIGFFPAVSEEFISRMFSIPFLQKAFRGKMTWLAIIIPAVIWGFGHSAYPNEPFYIRGLEVGLAGILIGLIMLRWGILATLVWHYTVDALYTAMLLFRSDNLYFMLTAAVATGLLVVPLLLALFAYWRRGAFLPETGLTNADTGTAPVEVAEPEPLEAISPPPQVDTVAYIPLPRSRRMLAIVILTVGCSAALIPVAKLGDFLSYPVTKSQAVKVFADSLRAVKWADPDTLKIAAFVRNEPPEVDDPMSYLLKHAGTVENFNHILDKTLGSGTWSVCAWVPENRLRYMGSVDARTGKLGSLYVLLPEEMPGDSLTEDSARSRVEQVMAHSEDMTKLESKDYRQTARPKRLDHSFTYESKDGDPRNVAEAKYRRSASVGGNYLTVSRYPWYKIPEQWERDRQAATPLRTVMRVLPLLLIGGFLIWAAIILALKARKKTIPWKKALLISLFPAALALLAGWNSFYLSQQDYFYNISQPFSVFRTITMLGWLIGSLVFGIYALLGAALLTSLYPEAHVALKRPERRAAGLDAALTAVATIGAMLLIRSFLAAMTCWQPANLPLRNFFPDNSLAAPLPLTILLQDTLSQLLTGLVLIGFIAYLWKNQMHRPLLRAILILAAVFILIPRNAIEPGEWVFAMVYGAFRVLVIYFLLKFIVAGRPVLFFMALISGSAYLSIGPALGCGNAAVASQAIAAGVIIFAAMAAWLGGFRLRVKP